MPIRIEHRHLYPPDWPELAAQLKAAAGWRCVCEGECGSDHGGRCAEVHGQPATWRRQREIAPGRAPRVVLTVGHLDHHPDNCDASNLRVWCQDCHLRHDRPEHARRRRATWAARRQARELARLRAPAQLALMEPAPQPPGAARAQADARTAARACAALYGAEKAGQVRFRFLYSKRSE